MLTIENVLLIIAVAGATGSLIEYVGIKFNLPRVIAFGKTVESFTADLPKFAKNIFGLFSGKVSQ